MVLRVKPAPPRFPTNCLYIPMDNTPLHSISSVCHPWVTLSQSQRPCIEQGEGVHYRAFKDEKLAEGPWSVDLSSGALF